MRILRIASLNKVAFAIGGRRYEDGDDATLGGKQYLIMGHSLDADGNLTVKLTGDAGDVELHLNSLGLSLDDATRRAARATT